ncbi:MAG TPA: NUDIX domain-containing protein [Frankiaceae bacterium]|nr:NUDIX domain-containing protein [Frankiaceae bacterium]
MLAAGGVVWRAANGDPRPTRSEDVEVAVVHRPKYDDWSLPKGKVDPGEQLVVAARREVAEETGLSATCGRVVGEQRYPVAAGPKFVRYWAMHDVTGTFEAQDEVDVLRWLPLAAAAACVDYPHDRGLLNSFAVLPPATTTVLVVRHGQAGSKKNWKADDLLRPLDPTGSTSAQRLASVASCYRPRRVLSAEPVRCLQTVQPTAARIGVPIEVEPTLGKVAAGNDARSAIRLVRSLVAEGAPAMLCSQGEVIPDLIRGLAEGGEVRLGTLNARKGSVWALSFADGRLIDADYLPDLAPAVPA